MIFLESFDYYNSTGAEIGLTSRWFYSGGGTNSVTMVAGRFGGQAVQLYGAPFGFGHHSYCYTAFGFSSDEFAVNVGVYLASGAGNGENIGIIEGTTFHLGVRFNGDGSVSIYKGGSINSTGTLLWTSVPALFQFNTWHTVGLRGIIHDSAGEVSLQWDGETLVTLSGIDTQNGGTATVNGIVLATQNQGVLCFDDIGAQDSNVFLPEMRIEQLLPNADGATLDFVPSTGSSHFAVVDEATVSVADYLSGSTVGDFDLLGIQDLASLPANIIGVSVVGFARKTDAGTRAVNLGLISGASEDLGDDHYLSSTTQRFASVYTEDPDTAAPWTQAGINGIQLKPHVAI